jgi:hypothetical protein
MLVVLAAPASAQSQASSSGGWLGFGFGGANGSGFPATSAVLAVAAYQRDAHHASIRLTTIWDPYGNAHDHIQEAGLLYGRIRSSRFVHARAAAGLSWTNLVQCEDPPDGCVTVGVPIDLEVGLHALPIVGVAVQAFANLNVKRAYGGVALIAQVGWLGNSP